MPRRAGSACEAQRSEICHAMRLIPSDMLGIARARLNKIRDGTAEKGRQVERLVPLPRQLNRSVLLDNPIKLWSTGPPAEIGPDLTLATRS